MAVSFTKNQDEITKAWSQVVDTKGAQKWALFGYEGNTNNIRLMSTGSNGLKELVREFNCSLIQYAFCRVLHNDTGINKLVLINWQGESSPLSRKGLCASHVGDVANYFKGCTQTITIRNDDEATEEYLMNEILKSSSTRVSLSRQSNDDNRRANDDEPSQIGSTYKKTDIKSEISVDRKSFWQRQEEEEKERILEEKRRAAEKQAQFDRERKLREESEAKKLAETIKERDRIIEATRQADRRESSPGSQPSSILSTNANKNGDDDDDDERVGRRSELIRLERNQETQSLISKGLIKNKRAIFEQASQQQQQQQQPPSRQASGSNLSRRSSGIVVTQRLNEFKSLDTGNNDSASVNVEKLTNGFAKSVNVSGDESAKSASTVKSEFETFKVTEDVKDQGFTPSVANDVASDALTKETSITNDTSTTNVSISEPKVEAAPVDETKLSKEALPVLENGSNSNQMKEIDSIDSNGNSCKPSKSSKQEPKLDSGVTMNGKLGVKAKALYDYQAADNTEISFDPDDIIGFIDKVDPGWWHGSVVTGQFKGQSGLFPANYVEELQ